MCNRLLLDLAGNFLRSEVYAKYRKLLEGHSVCEDDADTLKVRNFTIQVANVLSCCQLAHAVGSLEVLLMQVVLV